MTDLIHFLDRARGDVSLLLADVDDKKFNEHHGYKAGDAVLRQVFHTCKRQVGNHGEVSRRGREEIEMLLPFCDQARSAAIADPICQEVANTPVLYEGPELKVTLSVGVASSPRTLPNLYLKLRQAVLKKAKSEGKDRVIVSQ